MRKKPESLINIDVFIKGLLLVLCSSILNAANYDIETIESVSIIGTKADARKIAGSGTVISNNDLQKTVDTDIHKILAAVPGVFFRTEDGYGLRPNISIRGTSLDRSSKITIMEDGVLVAPAPYTSAAAYYFPTSGRINSLEVLKGPSAITQGPSTIGGAINMISTPIPTYGKGKFLQEIGDNAMTRTHLIVGSDNGTFGAMIERHEHATNGFDSIANVNSDTGFDKSDTLAKLRYTYDNHELTLKILKFDESSDQTYLGLSQASFDLNPRLRYGMSQYDTMINDGKQESLTYKGSINNVNIIATSWSNNYFRDWFKVDKANNQSAYGLADGINDVIDAANSGNIDAQGILDGRRDVQVRLKHNNRFYNNEGVQFQISTSQDNHNLVFGYRNMKDSESRLQNYECYDQFVSKPNSSLSPCGEGWKGSNNRLRVTSAKSYFLQDTINIEQLSLNIGYRSESYNRTENRWSDGSPTRLKKDPRYNNIKKSGDYSTLGFGATYDLNEQLKLVIGFYQGMSPVFNGEAEEADNTEIGLRYNKNMTSLELMFFSSDYENLVGTCSNSSGGDCDPGDTFSGGEVDVNGLEFNASWIFKTKNMVSFPMAITFTSTNASFKNSFSSDYFGNVTSGDKVPYIPSSVLAFNIGFKIENGWSGFLRLADHGSSCSTASCGLYENIEAFDYIDLTLRKKVNQKMELYLVIENATDNADIAARTPENGARSQKPRSYKLGFSYQF